MLFAANAASFLPVSHAITTFIKMPFMPITIMNCAFSSAKASAGQAFHS
jgi:hypothetical protein